MNIQKKSHNTLEDKPVNVKLKLATLWISFMFIYSYVDYFALFMPNTINKIIKGKVFLFDITPSFILAAIGALTIPTLMIFLSVVLPAKVNRLTNIIVAIIHIPYMLFNLAGEVWTHMVFAAIVEFLMLALIILYAWRWPKIDE